MTKIIEKNVAVIIVIALFSVVLLSGCASTASCGNASFIKNAHLCPAYH